MGTFQRIEKDWTVFDIRCVWTTWPFSFLVVGCFLRSFKKGHKRGFRNRRDTLKGQRKWQFIC